MENILSYSWSPKGNGIAFAASFGQRECLVRYYDMVTKQLRPLYRTQIESFGQALSRTTLEWLPDSERFLFSTAESPKSQGIALIDAKKGMVRKLSIEGRSPRYFESDKILFSHDAKVWVVNTDGRNKKTLISIGAAVVYLSNVRSRKVILQTFEMKEVPSRLFLLDLQNNRLEEIKTKDLVLYCPRFSPDGQKFTAIGLGLKYNQPGTEEEPKPGYYVFDLINKKVTLLKRFDFSGREGYWFGIYMAGYGNYTNWK
jgi:Tol biopolymer transport system component